MDWQGPYQHQPLPSERSFRLLKIVESNDVWPHFVIETFEKVTAPPYIALSYMWGRAVVNPDEPEPGAGDLKNACCSGAVFPITENLQDALLQLERSKEFGYLWVDAICIDQANLKERKSQVLRMGDIFAGTECVIVWL